MPPLEGKSGAEDQVHLKCIRIVKALRDCKAIGRAADVG